MIRPPAHSGLAPGCHKGTARSFTREDLALHHEVGAAAAAEWAAQPAMVASSIGSQAGDLPTRKQISPAARMTASRSRRPACVTKKLT